jgi:hypothetical protein
MIRSLLKLSGGITGRVTWLLGRAAESAIDDGDERIEQSTLTRVNDTSRVSAA